MSFKSAWDIDKYREEHESDEHWILRRNFMERWQTNYPEERLVCLARVFANIEFMGCRYPVEVMQEVAQLSKEVAQSYRNDRKTKLQRTFVSASDAAEDRARGIKREGGIVKSAPANKSAKISFVPQGFVSGDQSPGRDDYITNDADPPEPADDNESVDNTESSTVPEINNSTSKECQTVIIEDYLNDLLKMNCVNIRKFRDYMFMSEFGRFVLIIRPWAAKLSNIMASSQVCHLPVQNTYENGCCTLMLNGKLLAKATGSTKAEAKSNVETIAWDRLKRGVVSLLIKQQFMAHGDSEISVNEISGKKSNEDMFGTPVQTSVAEKMMKLMGWKGGGLGAEAQGIAEPIKPNLQMVNRAGLGSSGNTQDTNRLRKNAMELMKRYIASDTIDLDLVFSSEFTKEERVVLHQMAQRLGLSSKSYGKEDRFLVVKKKLNPFTLVQAIVEKGGDTPKYAVFLPAALNRR